MPITKGEKEKKKKTNRKEKEKDSQMSDFTYIYLYILVNSAVKESVDRCVYKEKKRTSILAYTYGNPIRDHLTHNNI